MTVRNGNVYVSWKWLVGVLAGMLLTVGAVAFTSATTIAEANRKCDVNQERIYSVNRRLDSFESNIDKRFDRLDKSIEDIFKKLK